MKRKFLMTSMVGLTLACASTKHEADRAVSSAMPGVPAVVQVFDPSVVGEVSTLFVDPIALCKRSNKNPESCHQFVMGSAPQPGVENIEPLHRVRLSKHFEIQATEVTAYQWLIVMNGHPDMDARFFDHVRCPPSGLIEVPLRPEGKTTAKPTKLCRNIPAQNMTYQQIQDFIDVLNQGQNRYTYALPTEAEWEYSARAGVRRADGTYPKYPFGDDLSKLDQYGWHGQNSVDLKLGYLLAEVAKKRPNAYGIYDMQGNVSEWVRDIYDEKVPYGLSKAELKTEVVDPTGPRDGDYRVLRGGYVADYAEDAFRASYRGSSSCDRCNKGRDLTSHLWTGFRLVRSPR